MKSKISKIQDADGRHHGFAEILLTFEGIFFLFFEIMILQKVVGNRLNLVPKMTG